MRKNQIKMTLLSVMALLFAQFAEARCIDRINDKAGNREMGAGLLLLMGLPSYGLTIPAGIIYIFKATKARKLEDILIAAEWIAKNKKRPKKKELTRKEIRRFNAVYKRAIRRAKTRDSDANYVGFATAIYDADVSGALCKNDVIPSRRQVIVELDVDLTD
ncbi:MAG: hypothetical protein JNL01_02600 [Bdellovibrionales bacterium]|nr:hypothetical protein [Bdellovibrionales bacterium]